jgi:hypothetical protein
MLKKLGKQVKLPPDSRFIAKYGTINALNPQSIFVSIHSWATPKHNFRFHKKLRTLSQSVKREIDESINYDVFHNKYIVDFDLRESGLQKDKQSFLAVEITLYPKNVIKFPNAIYDSNVMHLIKEVAGSIKRNRDFTFTPKKRK